MSFDESKELVRGTVTKSTIDNRGTGEVRITTKEGETKILKISRAGYRDLSPHISGKTGEWGKCRSKELDVGVEVIGQIDDKGELYPWFYAESFDKRLNTLKSGC
jgi:hypothetical protein